MRDLRPALLAVVGTVTIATIGGKNLVITLRWGEDHTEECRFAGALPGIKFALAVRTR